ERFGIEFPKSLPMLAGIVHQQEIAKVALKAVLEFAAKQGALEVGVNLGKLIEPELQVVSFPNGIGILGIVQDREKLRVVKAQAEQLPVDVVNFHKGFRLAL